MVENVTDTDNPKPPAEPSPLDYASLGVLTRKGIREMEKLKQDMENKRSIGREVREELKSKGARAYFDKHYGHYTVENAPRERLQELSSRAALLSHLGLPLTNYESSFLTLSRLLGRSFFERHRSDPWFKRELLRSKVMRALSLGFFLSFLLSIYEFTMGSLRSSSFGSPTGDMVVLIVLELALATLTWHSSTRSSRPSKALSDELWRQLGLYFTHLVPIRFPEEKVLPVTGPKKLANNPDYGKGLILVCAACRGRGSIEWSEKVRVVRHDPDVQGRYFEEHWKTHHSVCSACQGEGTVNLDSRQDEYNALVTSYNNMLAEVEGSYDVATIHELLKLLLRLNEQLVLEDSNLRLSEFKEAAENGEWLSELERKRGAMNLANFPV
jgi:hypothetical protein